MMQDFYIVVTPFFPSPTRWQGAYCFDFVRALQRELELRVGVGEWKVLVFKPGNGEDYEYQGITVHTFRERNLPSAILPFLFRRYNERSFLNKVKEVLNSTLRLQLETTTNTATQVAVCHAHTARCAIYALAVKRFNPNCRTFLHHHDPQSFGLGMGVLRHCALYNAWLFRRFRKVFDQIDGHVFISEMVKRSFLSAPDATWTQYENYRRQMRGPRFFHCRPVRIKRSIILHNGVDTSIFHPTSTPPSPRPFTIGCVANLEDWKDPITLIKACVMVQKKHKVKVICVGSGADVPEMKRLAAEGGLDLEIRSEVDHTQLPSFYHELDLFVLPSYFEGFGCVFTEAYASGVPFITCEGQGMDDLVADNERSLWLCKPRDPEDLADKIMNYIENRPQQHLKGEIRIGALVARYYDILVSDGFVRVYYD